MNLGILGTPFSSKNGTSAVETPPAAEADSSKEAPSPSSSPWERSGSQGDPPPWLNARYEFNRTYADLYRGKRSWKIAFFAALALAALASAGLIQRVMTSKITPYVIERDRLGQVRYAGPLPAAPETPAQALVEAELTSLIRDLRTISTDPAIQKELIAEAFVHISGQASQYLDDYFSQKGKNPRALGRKLRRSVQISSIIKVPDTKTYKVEWSETTRPRQSTADPKSQAWEAYLSVEQHDPERVEVARKNPLGLYVTDIEWAKVSGSGVALPEETRSSQ